MQSKLTNAESRRYGTSLDATVVKSSIHETDELIEIGDKVKENSGFKGTSARKGMFDYEDLIEANHMNDEFKGISSNFDNVLSP